MHCSMNIKDINCKHNVVLRYIWTLLTWLYHSINCHHTFHYCCCCFIVVDIYNCTHNKVWITVIKVCCYTRCSAMWWQNFKRMFYISFRAKMSNKIQLISEPLSSYMLVKWTRTAVTWSSSCLYTAWLVAVGVGVAALYCSGAVKTPNTFTNDEYANIKLAYGLCNANCRAAVVGFHLCHPHCETFETIHRIWRRLVPSYQ